VGIPFKEYLNRYRIDKAAEFVSSGEKVSVAANLCGYNEFSTFYRNFKKYKNLSPSEFGNKTKKERADSSF
jgi:two-component system response regulator YesN